MNSKVIAIGLGIALLFSTGLLGRIGWLNFNLNSANKALNKELMQAKLEIGRAETQFGDANKYIKELEKEIQKEIKERDAKLTRIGKLEAELQDLKKKKDKIKEIKLEGPTIEVPKDLNLRIGMLYQAITSQELQAIEGFDAKYQDHRIGITASVRPEPNPLREIPVYWQYELDLKLRGTLAETITPSGAINNYITIWEIDNEGKDVKQFKLTAFNTIVEDLRKPKFFWWSPHLDIGLHLGAASTAKFAYSGSLGFSTSGYGLTKNDLSWRFLRLSLDLSDSPGIGLTPFTYNIAEMLPILSNIWIGPHISFSPENGQSAFGAFIGGVL